MIPYPVTQPFGYDPTYPLNAGNHRGIDYGYPEGTPVVVNGVQIGLSGHTGQVTGPHLHIGKFINGGAVDPGVGNGLALPDAVVYDTGYDTVNGNYVRISSGGAIWVYLHLSKITASQGQKLEEEQPMPEDYKVNQGDIINIRSWLGLSPATDDDFARVGQTWKQCTTDYMTGAEYAAAKGNVNHVVINGTEYVPKG